MNPSTPTPRFDYEPFQFDPTQQHDTDHLLDPNLHDSSPASCFTPSVSPVDTPDSLNHVPDVVTGSQYHHVNQAELHQAQLHQGIAADSQFELGFAADSFPGQIKGKSSSRLSFFHFSITGTSALRPPPPEISLGTPIVTSAGAFAAFSQTSAVETPLNSFSHSDLNNAFLTSLPQTQLVRLNMGSPFHRSDSPAHGNPPQNSYPSPPGHTGTSSQMEGMVDTNAAPQILRHGYHDSNPAGQQLVHRGRGGATRAMTPQGFGNPAPGIPRGFGYPPPSAGGHRYPGLGQGPMDYSLMGHQHSHPNPMHMNVDNIFSPFQQAHGLPSGPPASSEPSTPSSSRPGSEDPPRANIPYPAPGSDWRVRRFYVENTTDVKRLDPQVLKPIPLAEIENATDPEKTDMIEANQVFEAKKQERIRMKNNEAAKKSRQLKQNRIKNAELLAETLIKENKRLQKNLSMANSVAGCLSSFIKNRLGSGALAEAYTEAGLSRNASAVQAGQDHGEQAARRESESMSPQTLGEQLNNDNGGHGHPLPSIHEEQD